MLFKVVGATIRLHGVPQKEYLLVLIQVDWLRRFQISSCMYRYLNEESGMMQMDKESIREDLVLLGRGIVRKVVFSDE